MIKKIKNSFVNEPVNLGRQSELDVAKGIAIIFMVFAIHLKFYVIFLIRRFQRILLTASLT